MKKIMLAMVTLTLSPPLMAQTEAEDKGKYIACLTGLEMNRVFQAGDTDRLPGYEESAGARVQHQFPKTQLRGQAKYIEAGGKSLGICEYHNHVGVVSVFKLAVVADASDGVCDDGGLCKKYP